jgi:hypothetical protein
VSVIVAVATAEDHAPILVALVLAFSTEPAAPLGFVAVRTESAAPLGFVAVAAESAASFGFGLVCFVSPAEPARRGISQPIEPAALLLVRAEPILVSSVARPRTAYVVVADSHRRSSRALERVILQPVGQRVPVQ